MNLPLAEPGDGWESYEKIFFRDTLCDVYKSIPTITDKFIFIAIKEAGYTEGEVAQIFEVSQVAICKRLRKTIRFLREINRTHTESVIKESEKE